MCGLAVALFFLDIFLPSLLLLSLSCFSSSLLDCEYPHSFTLRSSLAQHHLFRRRVYVRSSFVLVVPKNCRGLLLYVVILFPSHVRSPRSYHILCVPAKFFYLLWVKLD
ncbi:hypothetical protein BDV98DRAFT_112371 [Pterulicium gracile]|uniref:Secreted protein n=1 Tax=Pterulicium gracile TaxID=1884261 RepID=A0A5C3QGS5_9AGAR|nr:hypothetical protein BDV98DRAFT_112371 [Pterula gracilis]